MSTDTLPIEAPAAASDSPDVRRPTICLSAVSWEDYLAFQELFDRQRGYRLAYDGGALEIMSPTLSHDDDSRFLGDLVRMAARAADLPTRRGGSVTMRSELALKGVEPDDCLWIQNAERIAGVTDLDLQRDPPPDLSIEVDVSHSYLKRFSIYAALGIPELWRLEKKSLTFSLLDESGTYNKSPVSRTLPELRPEHLLPFVVQARNAVDQGEVLDRFRHWYREFLTRSGEGE